jgi:hypothetical protein|tara:strand:+ start:632 stop:790 length:159 start_codon:yes stop_codon:yes gene_type:complete
MTDYGDEALYTIPWDMFDEDSAKTALNAACRCKSSSEDIVKHIHQWRSKEDN